MGRPEAGAAKRVAAPPYWWNVSPPEYCSESRNILRDSNERFSTPLYLVKILVHGQVPYEPRMISRIFFFFFRDEIRVVMWITVVVWWADTMSGPGWHYVHTVVDYTQTWCWRWLRRTCLRSLWLCWQGLS